MDAAPTAAAAAEQPPASAADSAAAAAAAEQPPASAADSAAAATIAAATSVEADAAETSTESLVDNNYDCSCCVRGVLHSGTPTGSVVQLAGGTVPTYVARPADDAPNRIENAAVIIFTDIFGFELPNTRLVADRFAAAGLACYVPDILNGDPISPTMFDEKTTKPTSVWGKIVKGAKFAATMTSMLPWFLRHSDSVTLPICEKVVRALRQEHKISKLAGIGYCFGGRPVCLHAGTTVPEELRLDCFATAHPARIAVPADINKITVPSLWIIPETDFSFSKKDGQQVQKILSAKHEQCAASAAHGGRNPMEFVFREYAGCTHGFAIRGDEDDPVVVKARDDALAEAIAFFRRHLAAQA